MSSERATLNTVRILGIDPGLRHMGWGVIDVTGNRLQEVADGVIHSDDRLSMAERLAQLHQALAVVVATYAPDEAAVEETFVNNNPLSALKLGQARGVALLTPAVAGIPVSEYAPAVIKKAVVGTGAARKEQVGMMVRTLLPGCLVESPDAADALALAICHAHHRTRPVTARASEASPPDSPAARLALAMAQAKQRGAALAPPRSRRRTSESSVS